MGRSSSQRSLLPIAEQIRNLAKIRQIIGHLKTRIFGFAPAGQLHGRQEIDELATAITEYGRMRQEHYRLSIGCSGRRETSDAVTRNHPDHRQGVRGAEGSGPRSKNRRTRTMETALHRARGATAGLSIGRSRKARRTAPLKQMLGSGCVSHFPADCNLVAFLCTVNRPHCVSYNAEVHKSPARCRRSQVPLASSHSSSERTLARASAIEQSAAP
jgi:hypothetical protein